MFYGNSHNLAIMKTRNWSGSEDVNQEVARIMKSTEYLLPVTIVMKGNVPPPAPLY